MRNLRPYREPEREPWWQKVWIWAVAYLVLAAVAAWAFLSFQ